jgi:hypothetical protein
MVRITHECGLPAGKIRRVGNIKRCSLNAKVKSL